MLLTGATGYVGGPVLHRLEEEGERVRCLPRGPGGAEDHAGTAEIVAGDVLDMDTPAPALEGVDVAYYLVHSTGSGGSFQEEDRRAAANFAAAAKAAGVRRIVYLGELGAGTD